MGTGIPPLSDQENVRLTALRSVHHPVAPSTSLHQLRLVALQRRHLVFSEPLPLPRPQQMLHAVEDQFAR